MSTINATPPSPDQYAILLDKLISGSIGPLSNLQEAVNLTLDQVSSWIAKPRTRQQIDNLSTLLNAQTQLMMCQHRLFAVAKLAEVAATASAPETIRRACVDLLKFNLCDLAPKPDPSSTNGPAPMERPDEITEAMILRAVTQVAARHRPSYKDHESSNQAAPVSDAPARADGPEQGRIEPPPLSLFSQKGTDAVSASPTGCAPGPAAVGVGVAVAVADADAPPAPLEPSSADGARTSQRFSACIGRSRAYREAVAALHADSKRTVSARTTHHEPPSPRPRGRDSPRSLIPVRSYGF